MSYKPSNTKEQIAYHMRHIDRILEPEKSVNRNGWTKINLKKELSKPQREVLKKWVQHRSLNGLKIGATQNRLYFFRKFGVFIKGKDWKKVTKQDTMNFLDALKKQGSSDASMFVYKCYLGGFYHWLYEMPTGEYPKCVGWMDIKGEAKRRKSKRTVPYSEQPNKWITDKEFMKLIKHVDPRSKALLWLMWDTGARINELLGLKIKDILIYNNTEGDIIIKDGKTGDRKIMICKSVLPVKQWIQNHYDNQNNEAWLFYQYSTNRYGEKLEWSGVSNTLNKYKKLTKLKKKITAHMFRHSKAIRMRRDGFSDEEIAYTLGWNGTNMMKTYFHIDRDMMRNKLLQAEGFKTKAKEESEVKVEDIICPFCKESNRFTAKFCEECGGILNDEIANKRLKEELKARRMLNDLKEISKDKELIWQFKKLRSKAKLNQFEKNMKDYVPEISKEEYEYWEEKHLEAEEDRRKEEQIFEQIKKECEQGNFKL